MRSPSALVPILLVLALALGLGACQTDHIVNVDAQPCECACSFKATTPQVGKGCWVNGDLLVCPLVRRDLDIEPAYPSEDPRCTKLPNGEIQCAIHPGDTALPETPELRSGPDPED